MRIFDEHGTISVVIFMMLFTTVNNKKNGLSALDRENLNDLFVDLFEKQIDKSEVFLSGQYGLMIAEDEDRMKELVGKFVIDPTVSNTAKKVLVTIFQNLSSMMEEDEPHHLKAFMGMLSQILNRHE